jgi:hypothetical protein
MTERLILSQFTLPPLDVPSMLALAHALLAAIPPNPPVHVMEAAAEVKAAIKALEAVWGARGNESKKPDPRPIDRRVDLSWSSFFWRIDTLATLPHDLYPRAVRARVLRDQIFPGDDRLGFTKIPYKAEWAEVKKRLDLIDRENLAPEIDDLAGPEFLQEMTQAFALYGEVLGITKVAPADETPEPLLDELRELGAAITDYTVAVLSTIQRKKPDTQEAALVALRPLTEAREASRRPTPPTPPDNPPTPEPS